VSRFRAAPVKARGSSARIAATPIGLEHAMLTSEERLDLQEFYFRYTECLDGGRLQHWPEFFTEPCVYRVTTLRGMRMGPDADLVSFDSKSIMLDRIVALDQSEDFEPHHQRHFITNVRAQTTEDHELRVFANLLVIRTFPGKRSELFVSGCYQDRLVRSGGRLKFQEKLVILDSEEAPDGLIYPV
jgi:anthranilate 1,2-dioxygenase small subunit